MKIGSDKIGPWVHSQHQQSGSGSGIMTGEMDQEWIVGAEATLERDAGNPLPNGWFVQKKMRRDVAPCP